MRRRRSCSFPLVWSSILWKGLSLPESKGKTQRRCEIKSGEALHLVIGRRCTGCLKGLERGLGSRFGVRMAGKRACLVSLDLALGAVQTARMGDADLGLGAFGRMGSGLNGACLVSAGMEVTTSNGNLASHLRLPRDNGGELVELDGIGDGGLGDGGLGDGARELETLGLGDLLRAIAAKEKQRCTYCMPYECKTTDSMKMDIRYSMK